jgi:transposase InsO family protein
MEDLLHEEVSEPKQIYARSPELQIKINSFNKLALIDTGSEISCVSELFFEQVKQKNPNIPVLPVPAITITGAVGTRERTAKQQVLLTVGLGSWTGDIVFIVVPGLIREIILGIDWLQENKVNIDCDTKTLTIDNVEINFLERNNFEQTHTIATIHLGEDELEHPANRESDRVRAPELINRGEQSKRTLETSVEQIHQCLTSIETLDSGKKNDIEKLLLNFKHVFSEKPGLTDKYEHKLELTDDTPFKQKSYPIPFAHREAVNEQIATMLEWNIIERSPTQFTNPLVANIKKNGDVRICMDARQLNRRLVQDHECPLDPEEVLQRFEKIKFMSTIDLRSSYWQIPLRPSDRQYAGFLHEGKSYVFRVLPFGISTAVGGFTRAMDIILGSEVTQFTTAYIDDLLVTSETWEEHLHHLKLVLKRLEEAGMTVNFEKSQWCQNQVKFLGHILTSDGLKTDPEKRKAIQDFPKPRNTKHLRAFIGSCNYYRKFCDHFSDLIAPMLTLLRKGVRWKWDDKMQTSFEATKSAFLDTIMLNHPLRNRRYYIQTDSSGHALGSVIFQYDETGRKRVLAFASRTLSAAERGYSTTEREGLAVIYALMKWRTHVLGSPLTVLSDHKSLSFIMKARLTNSRLTRWVLILQEYNFEIEYIKGTDNIVADTLSRYPADKSEEANFDYGEKNRREFRIADIKFELNKTVRADLRKIAKLQKSDDALRPVYDHLTAGDPNATDRIVKLSAAHSIRDGTLYRKGKDDAMKICVPQRLIKDLVLNYHESLGHVGAQKCIEALREGFTWPHLTHHVRKILAPCVLCQRSKWPNKRHQGLMQTVKASKPGELVALDLFGALPRGKGGVQYILVVLDVFSKLVKLYTLKHATTKNILNKLTTDYFIKVGKPTTILSDHGSQFTAHKWYATLEAEGVKPVHSSIRHPESNPSERVMRELGRMFRAVTHDKHTAWPAWVKTIEFWLANVTHDSTGFTPIELHFNNIPDRGLSKIFNVPMRDTQMTHCQKIKLANDRFESRAERRRLRHDRGGNATTYQIGDKVWLRANHQSSAERKEIKKFFLLYNGPYSVVNTVGANAYELEGAEGNIGVHNVANLKPVSVLISNQQKETVCLYNFNQLIHFPLYSTGFRIHK